MTTAHMNVIGVSVKPDVKALIELGIGFVTPMKHCTCWRCVCIWCSLDRIIRFRRQIITLSKASIHHKSFSSASCLWWGTLFFSTQDLPAGARAKC